MNIIDLGNNILDEIFAYLDPGIIDTICLVCKHFRTRVIENYEVRDSLILNKIRTHKNLSPRVWVIALHQQRYIPVFIENLYKIPNPVSYPCAMVFNTILHHNMTCDQVTKIMNWVCIRENKLDINIRDLQICDAMRDWILQHREYIMPIPGDAIWRFGTTFISTYISFFKVKESYRGAFVNYLLIRGLQQLAYEHIINKPLSKRRIVKILARTLENTGNFILIARLLRIKNRMYTRVVLYAIMHKHESDINFTHIRDALGLYPDDCVLHYMVSKNIYGNTSLINISTHACLRSVLRIMPMHYEMYAKFMMIVQQLFVLDEKQTQIASDYWKTITRDQLIDLSYANHWNPESWI